MEGNHQQELATDAIQSRTVNRLANGSSDDRCLAAINAKLVRENQQLARERDLLRTLINSLPDRIYAKDKSGRFVFNNPAHVHMVGAPSWEEMKGKTDFDYFPKEQAEQFFADEQKIMATGAPLLNQQQCTANPDDSSQKLWVAATKAVWRDERGEVLGTVGITRNIQELKDVEDELKARTSQLSRERLLLRTLIDNLPDCVYAKDTAGRKTLANPADLKNLRCKTEADAIGKNDFDLFPREIAEKFWADDQKVIQGQPVINREEFFLDEHGQKNWLLTSKLPLRDPAGNIIGLIGIGRNITEQKQAEALVAYEQQLFQRLLETMPDNIYFKDLESRFVRVSRSKVEATLRFVRQNHRNAHPDDSPDSWPPHLADAKSFGEWLIGKTDFDTYPEIHARAAREDEQEIIRTGKPVISKVQKTELPDGKVIWWLSTKMPWLDEEGKVIGTFGASLDVTQLKQTEELLDQERVLLRTLIDNLPDCIYAKDAAGRFVLNNLAHAQRRGVKSPAEMKGKSDADYFPRVEAENFFADEQKIIQTGLPIINQEQYTSGPGGNRWVVVSKVIWRDDHDHVLGTVGITRDVHEFKMAREALRANEAKLREFAAQLERSNHELQDFAYVASHDLQEPLRKIVVFGERLKEKAADSLQPETLDYLQRMQKAAARMQTLINDLLAFSRVTTKAQPFTPVNLAQTAQEVMEDLEGRIEMTQGRVEVGDLPVIDAEPLQMRQLLQNLVGNALKFRRPEAPPVVNIQAKIFTGILPEAPPETTPQEWCELTVSDNGIGFDEKYLDRIFNVFQRLHTRTEYEGNGMGLAIVRKIVLHHGGVITARSTPGQGAAFIATLPLSHPKSNHPAP